jgi:hypothetical protein
MAAVGEQLERAYLDLADRQSNINGISKPEQVE